MYSYWLDGPYNDDCDDTPPEQRKLEERIDESGYLLKEIIKALYGKEDLDKSALEWHIDELCDKLGVKINVGTLEIERRNATIGSIAHFMANVPF
jgi:hypothetical protein